MINQQYPDLHHNGGISTSANTLQSKQPADEEEEVVVFDLHNRNSTKVLTPNNITISDTPSQQQNDKSVGDKLTQVLLDKVAVTAAASAVVFPTSIMTPLTTTMEVNSSIVNASMKNSSNGSRNRSLISSSVDKNKRKTGFNAEEVSEELEESYSLISNWKGLDSLNQ